MHKKILVLSAVINFIFTGIAYSDGVDTLRVPLKAVSPQSVRTTDYIKTLEMQVAAIESRGLTGEYDGVSYSSGMTAVSEMFFYAIEALKKKKKDINKAEIILFRPAYGCTDNLTDELKALVNIKVITGVKDLHDAVNENTALVYFESPTNPSLKIFYIEKIVNIVKLKNNDTLVGFDNTFATSLGQEPLKFGVDIVMVGITKCMSGPGDALGGVNVARKDIALALRKRRDIIAEPISLEDARITVKHGLPLLDARLKIQQSNAFIYVDFLKKMKQRGLVSSINYPGDPGYEDYETAEKQMDNFGHMIYFDLGTEKKAKAFLSLVKYFRTFELAVSLGQIRNLVELAAGGTHATVSPEDRKAGGITDSGIRWSIGIEDPKDVLRELEAMFSILELYKDNLDAIPYKVLNKIFMAEWNGPNGEEEYLVRKMPVVRRKKGRYTVELSTENAIKRIRADMPDLITTANIINNATKINQYNPVTLCIEHTFIYALLSGNHRVTTASRDGTTALRFEKPEDMKSAFESLGGFLNGGIPRGATQIYTRLGTAEVITLETLIAMLETGTSPVFASEYYGFSTPSLKSAIRLILLNQLFKYTNKENKEPTKIMVITSKGTDLDKVSKLYKKGPFSKLKNEHNKKLVDIEIIYANENTKENIINKLTGEISLVFVDDTNNSGFTTADIQALKEKTNNAKIAWNNTEGFQAGVQPVKDGAYFSIAGFKDGVKDMGAVITVPQADANDFTITRKDNSTAMRYDNCHDILLHILSDILTKMRLDAVPSAVDLDKNTVTDI